MAKIKDETKYSFESGLDLIYLAVCAVWDVTPKKTVMEKMNLSDVFRLAKYQSMAAVSYYGLEKWLCDSEGASMEIIDAELSGKWQQARDMAIKKNLMLDMEREALFSYLEEHGIWYMPLKGSLLKDLYPRAGMRQMADNDILIDAAYRKQIYDYMIGKGYEGEYLDGAEHDEYLKKPIYNFEMHHALFSLAAKSLWQEYYEDVIKRLIKIREDGCEYRFRDEDFYIYMTAHAYKHHSHKGNGIRHLMDVQIYLHNKPSMDWKYIQGELEHLGIADYEKIVRTIANKLFAHDCRSPEEMEPLLSTEERAFLELCIGLGTYGTTENDVKNNLRRSLNGEKLTLGRRIKYSWNRLFYREALYFHFPKLAKYKILHPVLYVARLFKTMIYRRKLVREEIEVITKMQDEKE